MDPETFNAIISALALAMVGLVGWILQALIAFGRDLGDEREANKLRLELLEQRMTWFEDGYVGQSRYGGRRKTDPGARSKVD